MCDTCGCRKKLLTSEELAKANRIVKELQDEDLRSHEWDKAFTDRMIKAGIEREKK